MLHGIGASEGIGIGQVLLLKERDLMYTPRQVTDTGAEKQRFEEAAEAFCRKTELRAQLVAQSAGENEAGILRGHILMIQDPYMAGEIKKGIDNGQCAEAALEAVCDMFIAMFSAADDELTNQRAADVRDIKAGVLGELLGVEEADVSSAPPGTVLVAYELTPSVTAGIRRENVAGIVTQVGGKTSHSAILARALQIPAVLGIENITGSIQNDDFIIVDGGAGVVIPNPSPETTAEYESRRSAFLKSREALRDFVNRPTLTADGRQAELVCNIGTPREAQDALDCGGEGVGLFRTEFLFLDNNSIPTEEEQFEAYKSAAAILKGRPLIIRTLDAGGDKDIPYLGLEKEENPFLGFRAVRYCLNREDVFRPQLRAILRAAAFGDVRVMLPLVTGVEELREAKSLIKELARELREEGVQLREDIPVGVMIETPAASQIADLLAKEADFFSIGTNDLTQYTMAVDRGNPKVSYLYSHLSPAVLRSIRHIIACAGEAHIPVGMCGEAAADPLLIPLLLSFGLDEFSVTPACVPATRRTISLWSKAEADEAAQKALSLATRQEVEEYLSSIQK